MSAKIVANAPFRHLDTTNMLYVDGHAKAHKGGITGYPALPGHNFVDGNRGNWTNSDQDRPQ
jgi:prepilin-type processing-associated H-X9-DG protein